MVINHPTLPLKPIKIESMEDWNNAIKRYCKKWAIEDKLNHQCSEYPYYMYFYHDGCITWNDTLVQHDYYDESV